MYFAHLRRPPQHRVFFQAGLRAGRRNRRFPGNHLPMSHDTVAHQIAVILLTVAGAASDLRWPGQAHRFPVSPVALRDGHLKKCGKASNKG